MSYTRQKAADFGPAKAGLSTVRYTLSDGASWVTAGVAESAAQPGLYSAVVTFADGFTGLLTWDTGEGGGAAQASEEINPGDAVAIGPGGITAASFAANAFDANALATSAVSEIVAAIGGGGGGGGTDPWATTLPASYTGNQAGKMLADLWSGESGLSLKATVVSGTASSLVLAVVSGYTFSSVIDDYADRLVKIVASTAAGRVGCDATASGWNPGTATLTLSRPFKLAPAVGDTLGLY